MKIYLMRHADALSGKELSDREKNSLGLTRYGRLESSAAAKALKKESIAKIVSSPLQRARETASLITRVIDAPVSYDERLREFSPDLDSKDALLLKNLKREARANPDMAMWGGESLNGAVERLSTVLYELRTNIENNVCIVSHRVVIESFLAKHFGLRIGESEWLRSASVTAIEFKGDKPLVIFYDRRYRDWKLLLATVARRLGIYDDTN